MRITKDPETRRREILEAAIALFNEKGYEQTSMQDITTRLGVSQGLCYRYFKSKEEILEAAQAAYVAEGVEAFRALLGSDTQPLAARLEGLVPLADQAGTGSAFGAFVNAPANSSFHAGMQLALCGALVPVVAKALEAAAQKGEITIADPAATAAFCLYGQLGVWQQAGVPPEEKTAQSKAFIRKALGL